MAASTAGLPALPVSVYVFARDEAVAMLQGVTLLTKDSDAAAGPCAAESKLENLRAHQALVMN